MQFTVAYVAAAMAIAAAALPQAQTNTGAGVQCLKDSINRFMILKSDCETAIKKLNTPGDEDVDGGPICDRMLRDEHDYVTVGTCTVTSKANGNAHCQEPKDVAKGAQKVLDACQGSNAKFIWTGDAVVSGDFKVVLSAAEPKQSAAATTKSSGDNWVWSK